MQLATARLIEEPDRIVHGPVFEGTLHDTSATWSTPAELVAAAIDAAGRDRIAAAAASCDAHPVDSLRLLPPVPRPARIVCIGVNYADHAAETGRSGEASTHPVVFTRFPSSIVGDGSPLERPAVSVALDYEGELAVVIGRRARSVPPDRAADVIAGYSCFMDGTVRDFQRHTTQFTPGKNFDRSGAFGPYLVTADEVGDLLGDGPGLALTTTVNGEIVQRGRTTEMIHGIAELVAYCSTFTTLEPGDVIATGTPSGVGAARVPPAWLVPGDDVAVEIERVGTLRNPVIDAPDTAGGSAGNGAG